MYWNKIEGVVGFLALNHTTTLWRKMVPWLLKYQATSIYLWRGNNNTVRFCIGMARFLNVWKLRNWVNRQMIWYPATDYDVYKFDCFIIAELFWTNFCHSEHIRTDLSFFSAICIFRSKEKWTCKTEPWRFWVPSYMNSCQVSLYKWNCTTNIWSRAFQCKV